MATLNKEQVLYYLRSLKKEITPEKLAVGAASHSERDELSRSSQEALEHTAPRLAALATAIAFIEEHHG